MFCFQQTLISEWEPFSQMLWMRLVQSCTKWEANQIITVCSKSAISFWSHITFLAQDFFSEKMKNELTASFANPGLTVTSGKRVLRYLSHRLTITGNRIKCDFSKIIFPLFPKTPAKKKDALNFLLEGTGFVRWTRLISALWVFSIFPRELLRWQKKIHSFSRYFYFWQRLWSVSSPE